MRKISQILLSASILFLMTSSTLISTNKIHENSYTNLIKGMNKIVIGYEKTKEINIKKLNENNRIYNELRNNTTEKEFKKNIIIASKQLYNNCTPLYASCKAKAWTVFYLTWCASSSSSSDQGSLSLTCRDKRFLKLTRDLANCATIYCGGSDGPGDIMDTGN